MRSWKSDDVNAVDCVKRRLVLSRQPRVSGASEDSGSSRSAAGRSLALGWTVAADPTDPTARLRALPGILALVCREALATLPLGRPIRGPFAGTLKCFTTQPKIETLAGVSRETSPQRPRRLRAELR